MHRLVGCVVLCLIILPTRPATAADAVGMIVDLVGRDDADFRAIGLDRIRHAAKGGEATRRFASLLATLPPERQVELTKALADRGDAAAIPAITAMLKAARDPATRSAAVAALGVLGGGAEVAVLANSLAAADPEKSAARRALAAIRGDDAVNRLVDAATSGDRSLRPVFIEILAERRVRAALPVFVAASTDADPAVRGAAMRALGRLAGPDQVPGMVQGYLKAASGSERTEAERALVAICTDAPRKEQAAEAFLAIFKNSNDADRDVLLSPLGRIGGPGALAVVDGLLADADPAKRALGLKALTRWPDATVAPTMLAMLGTSPDAATRDMLLGALIRIAPLPDNKLNDKQKLDLVQKTMTLCQKDDDRARLLERANAIRTVETFRFVLPYVDNASLAEPACKSIVELAHHQKLRDGHKEEFIKALDKVIVTTKNPELVERANRYKEGKTWARK